MKSASSYCWAKNACVADVAGEVPAEGEAPRSHMDRPNPGVVDGGLGPSSGRTGPSPLLLAGTMAWGLAVGVGPVAVVVLSTTFVALAAAIVVGGLVAEARTSSP